MTDYYVSNLPPPGFLDFCARAGMTCGDEAHKPYCEMVNGQCQHAVGKNTVNPTRGLWLETRGHSPNYKNPLLNIDYQNDDDTNENGNKFSKDDLVTFIMSDGRDQTFVRDELLMFWDKPFSAIVKCDKSMPKSTSGIYYKLFDNILVDSVTRNAVISGNKFIRLSIDNTLAQYCTISQSPKENAKEKGLQLGEQIFGGLSNYRVWRGKYNGLNVVVKEVRPDFFDTMKIIEGPNIVKVIANLPSSREHHRLAVMEELELIQFHIPKSAANSYNDGRNIWDTKYLKDAPKYTVHPVNKKLFSDLLKAIVHLNGLGYVWGDLKQENMGISVDGSLKIYDFDMMSSSKYYHTDLLAFGKLYYNALANQPVFAPGRHYNSDHFPLLKTHFGNMINAINDLDDETKQVLTKCFELNNNSTPEDMNEVILEFNKLLGDSMAW